MKSFLKQLFSSCLGTLLALGIILLIGITITINFSKKESPPRSGILHIPLEGTITEYGQVSINWDNFNFSGRTLNLWEIRNKIAAASLDKSIEGIYLEIKTVNISQTSVLDFIEILNDFKKSGKKIYAYSQYYDQNPYLASTVADSIFLNPNGGIDLKGYAIYSPFFNQILNKWEINFNVFYAGKYKGSTEPYRLDEFSNDNEYQLRKYLGTLHEQMVSIVSENRKINKEKIQEVVSQHQSYDAGFALKNGLVDHIYYEDEMVDFFDEKYGHHDFIPITTYKSKTRNKEKTDVAIVFAEGEIVWGNGSSGSIGHETYSKIFRDIKEDDKINKVIIRFNSPGGNGVASDNLHREIKLLQQSGKKVYASFGEMAASGAYYMAAACDSIFASPNTLTGSIGVYIMLPEFNDFLEEKIGITFDSISSAPNAITYSPVLNISSEEEKQLQQHTEKLYQQFLERVSDGRDISVDSADVLAQGRLWTGKDAEKKGLVDGIFSFTDVLKEITGEDELHKKSFKIYPDQKLTIGEQIIKERLGDIKSLEKLDEIKAKLDLIDFQQFADFSTPTMKLPFIINVINR